MCVFVCGDGGGVVSSSKWNWEQFCVRKVKGNKCMWLVLSVCENMNIHKVECVLFLSGFLVSLNYKIIVSASGAQTNKLTFSGVVVPREVGTALVSAQVFQPVQQTIKCPVLETMTSKTTSLLNEPGVFAQCSLTLAATDISNWQYNCKELKQNIVWPVLPSFVPCIPLDIYATDYSAIQKS